MAGLSPGSEAEAIDPLSLQIMTKKDTKDWIDKEPVQRSKSLTGS